MNKRAVGRIYKKIAKDVLARVRASIAECQMNLHVCDEARTPSMDSHAFCLVMPARNPCMHPAWTLKRMGERKFYAGELCV